MHPTPNDIHAIILDYGMVLCRRPSLEEINRIAQIFRVDHPTFWQLYEKNRGAYDKNDIGGKEYWDRFASDTNTHIDDDTLERLLRWDIEIWGHLEEALLDTVAASSRFSNGSTLELASEVFRSYPFECR